MTQHLAWVSLPVDVVCIWSCYEQSESEGIN